ncbi:MAG TPA: hypothetical protein VK453_11885 [Micromonosporaceae bacterium]|nr:hypothetical protein [Micromonosporaceae bacterium]
MRVNAVVDATLADALPAAVDALAGQTPPGWRFGLGPPSPDVRDRMVAAYAARLWWSWRKAGWRSPMGLLAGEWLVGTVLVAAAQPSLANAVAALVWMVVGAAALVPVVAGLLRCWRRRELLRPGHRQILWGADAHGWALVFLRRRTDGSWFAFNFMSTGGGVGRPVLRLGTTVADRLGVPIHLKTSGARLVRYYEELGFTVDRSHWWMPLTPMTYTPPALRRE